jgi:Ca2+-binding RTX toxin-like protein
VVAVLNRSTPSLVTIDGKSDDTIFNIENLTGGSGNDTLIGDINSNILIGGAGNDSLAGDDGNDLLSGDAGNDLLTGGAGNDSLTGGSGIDTFSVESGTDTISDLGVGGADILTVASGAIANATLGAAWTATAASINSGTEFLTSAGYAVDLSKVISGNGFTVTNTGLATTFTGSSGADTLIGGTGADTLIGGAGHDSLTGGAGNDLFIFNSTLDAKLNIDTITDFVSGQDKIQLNTTLFKSIGTGTALENSAFFAGTAAHAATDRIIYNKATGALLYDDDGNGSHAAVQVAILGTTDHPTQLLSSDFVVHG